MKVGRYTTELENREAEEEYEHGPSRVGLQDGIFIYRVPDTDLAHGTSLGNASEWATSKGTGAIEGLFSTALGLRVTGSLVVNVFAPYRDLLQYGRDDKAGQKMGADTLVRLASIGVGEFTIHPAYQKHEYDLLGGIHVAEGFFLPNTGFDDKAVVIKIVELTNASDREQTLALIGCVNLPGQTGADVVAHYNERLGAIVAHNQGNPDWVRIFGSLPHPDSFQASHDTEESWSPAYPLSEKSEEKGQIMASIQNTIFLRPGESKRLTYTLAFSHEGEKAAAKAYRDAADGPGLLEKTINHYREVINHSEIMTPDAMINQGVQWSKANMLRVLANYPTGIAFTNDPGKSSNVVVRDAAWFVYGNDFMLPEASCDMLWTIGERQQESGKIVEYYNALTGETEDYGLNINDDTPLYILACAHHIEVTGHEKCNDYLYPIIVKAADYIVSQEDDRGLVFCSADATGAYGIASWRNIIEDRAINGAVTEINAECYAALAAVSRIAYMRGNDEVGKRFDEEAHKLKNAINKHLKNPNNGMYYLNIDIHGNPISEITADEIFPVIFGVADEATSRTIMLRLSNPDFMTTAGLRTASRMSPLYSPDTLVGLQGGVWPGVTWWYAMASVLSDPSLMVQSLKRSYRQYTVRPSAYNTVPGQFSEWFDGESLVNRGMRLSPWEPPRFLWAMIEGAVGLDVTGSDVVVRPRVPHDWMWLVVRDMNTAAGKVNFFAGRFGDSFTMYTTSQFLKADNVEIYDTDLTDLLDPVTPDVVAVAYGRSDGIMVCFGNTSAEKKPAPFIIGRLLDNARRYHVQIYESEIGEWIDVGNHPGGSLARMSIEISPAGFALFKFGE